MSTKLDNITTQYRKFNVNQALTEGQLNEFIDYFEDQDRLSRTRLSGVGIVCGFKSTFDLEHKDTIAISQGAGVTTDGDLITLRENIDSTNDVSINIESKNYTYSREFKDEKANYPHFFNGGVQMNLLELFTTEEYEALLQDGANSIDFTPIADLTGVDNKVVILYLESYSNEDTPCEDADCDNNGSEQVSDLKVLLAEKEDVDNYIINGDKKDSIYSLYNDYEELYDTLKDIEAPRAIINAGITTEAALKAQFQSAIQSGNVVTDLVNGFNAIAATFNVNLNFNGQTLNTKLDQILSSSSDDYQYRYDLLKDLIDTYNEIRGLILHLKSICCPDIASFSKHLLLGTVGAPLNLGDHTEYRHDFYNSPINTNADENQQRLLLLANRFVQKVNDFQSYSGTIKITPSNENVTLGKKAIPFYYDLNQNLLSKWNFERAQTGKESYNLSYHTGSLSSADFVQNPLMYNIDDYDFYRIEGHLGMPYKIALQNINDLKTTYGLAFDVVPVVLKKGVTASKVETRATTTVLEPEVLYIGDLRNRLSSISKNVSRSLDFQDTLRFQNTLRDISVLDTKLSQLNDVAFTPSQSGVSVVKQDPKEKDIVPELLSDVLERNSGLEHFAGVPKGGTFYLICESDENNEVIADFAVPYLCCSKKDPVFLVLPATDLCQDDAKIPITILPLDGEIKAYVDNNEITGVTKLGGQNYFDPSLVSSQYYGQVITFTVNDDPVDTEIVVHAQPNVTVTTGDVVYSEDVNDPYVTVKFNIVSNTGTLTGLKYRWDFDDNSPVETVNATAEVTHTYQLTAGVQDIFNPKLTVINSNDCSTECTVEPLTLKLAINKNTKINIYFDSSGSMNSTLSPLTVMRDTLLKNRLLPLYGNDVAAYDANVKVISDGSERTFNNLNLSGGAAPEGNMIAMVFQDEAQPVYHTGSSITPLTNQYISDVQALKGRIQNNFGTGNSNYYRGIIFQVAGTGSSQVTFKSFLESVHVHGDSPNPAYSQNNLSTEAQNGKIRFEYGVTNGGTPSYYLDLIVQALESLGYNIP